MPSPSDLGNPRRLIGALFTRPRGYSRRSRRHDQGFSLRPNAPRLITCAAAVLLTVFGVSLTVIPIDAVNEFIVDRGWRVTTEHAWVALIASPLLLVAGSFLRGM